MLRFGGILMPDLLEERFDITRHQGVEIALFVVPIEIYPAVEISLPVFSELVVFTPKSFTTNVNWMGLVICCQRPGV